MNQAAATAAPTDIKIGGKTYWLTPMQASDWGEFEKWLQDRMFDVAARNIAKLPLEVQIELGKHAHDRATAIQFSSPEAVQAMKTMEGAIKLSWLSLRHRHPEITEDEVAILLFDPDVLAKVMDKFPMGMPDFAGEPKKKRTGSTAAKRKKRKRVKR